MIHLEEFSEKHLLPAYQWTLDDDLRKNFLLRRKLSPED